MQNKMQNKTKSRIKQRTKQVKADRNETKRKSKEILMQIGLCTFLIDAKVHKPQF